jgi:primosomal protein N''
MSNLAPFDRYNSRSLSRSMTKQFNRVAAELDVEMRLELARIEGTAEVQATRTDAIAYVARRGMQNVAAVSRIEVALVAMVPMASGRLAAIGDIAALAVADVVSDTARKVR